MWPIINNNGILETPDYPPYEPDSKGYGAICFSKMKEFEDRVAQVRKFHKIFKSIFLSTKT